MRRLVILFFVNALTHGRVFSPCELATTIKNYYHDSQFDEFVQNIPLIVCIAGYKNYNSSYRLTSEDGTGYYGLFGIHHSDINSCSTREKKLQLLDLLDDDIKDDFMCFNQVIQNNILRINFFDKLCSPPYVRYVPCRLDNYIIGKLIDPIHKDVFEISFNKEVDPSDILASRHADTSESEGAFNFIGHVMYGMISIVGMLFLNYIRGFLYPS
uniref:Uncharacterized protein n=1 Tax=Lygus hesperus TaxID=30085 RepID=A0A146KXU4_LYGHE